MTTETTPNLSTALTDLDAALESAVRALGRQWVPTARFARAQ
jgi:hypothetical protein